MTNNSFEVIIAGAGPVGLLLANLLGQAGIITLVVAGDQQTSEASLAIGLTPPSLLILHALELDEAFTARGVKVVKTLVHGDKGKLGELSFDSLAGPWRYILSLPEAEMVSLLENKLASWPCVELRRGLELTSLEQDEQQVRLSLRNSADQEVTLQAAYLVSGDDRDGQIRNLLQLRRQRYNYPHTFLLADHQDRTGLGSAAALWLTRQGSVDSFPLPEGKRRWIVQTGQIEQEPVAGRLEALVQERAGIGLDPADKVFETPVQLVRLLIEHYLMGRVILCGETAHQMGSMSGLGLNVGFGDAQRLAVALGRILRQQRDAGRELAGYESDRRPAAAAAILRTDRGLRFGSQPGLLSSFWRKQVIRLLLASALRRKLPPYFALTTLPGRSMLPKMPG